MFSSHDEKYPRWGGSSDPPGGINHGSLTQAQPSFNQVAQQQQQSFSHPVVPLTLTPTLAQPPTTYQDSWHSQPLVNSNSNLQTKQQSNVQCVWPQTGNPNDYPSNVNLVNCYHPCPSCLIHPPPSRTRTIPILNPNHVIELTEEDKFFHPSAATNVAKFICTIPVPIAEYQQKFLMYSQHQQKEWLQKQNQKIKQQMSGNPSVDSKSGSLDSIFPWISHQSTTFESLLVPDLPTRFYSSTTPLPFSVSVYENGTSQSKSTHMYVMYLSCPRCLQTLPEETRKKFQTYSGIHVSQSFKFPFRP